MRPVWRGPIVQIGCSADDDSLGRDSLLHELLAMDASVDEHPIGAVQRLHRVARDAAVHEYGRRNSGLGRDTTAGAAFQGQVVSHDEQLRAERFERMRALTTASLASGSIRMTVLRTSGSTLIAEAFGNDGIVQGPTAAKRLARRAPARRAAHGLRPGHLREYRIASLLRASPSKLPTWQAIDAARNAHISHGLGHGLKNDLVRNVARPQVPRRPDLARPTLAPRRVLEWPFSPDTQGSAHGSISTCTAGFAPRTRRAAAFNTDK